MVSIDTFLEAIQTGGVLLLLVLIIKGVIAKPPQWVPYWFYDQMRTELQEQNKRAVTVAKESTIAAKEIVETVRKES